MNPVAWAVEGIAFLLSSGYGGLCMRRPWRMVRGSYGTFWTVVLKRLSYSGMFVCSDSLKLGN